MRNQFRLTFSFTKNDFRAKLLKKLAHSYICSYDTMEDGEKTIKDFLLFANGVVKGDFSSYGVVNLIDEACGEIVASEHIGNEIKKVSFDELISDERY